MWSEEIVAKAIRQRKTLFAIGGDEYPPATLAAQIGIIEADALEFPDGFAAQWLKERNNRIERYAKQAETGPIQFELRGPSA